jgi:glucose-1-phosphate adenylyltransferase
MNFAQMQDYHQAKQSDFTISVMPVPTVEASRFGVLEVDSKWRIIGFEEKPEQPKEIPGQRGYSLVSMGNYIAELSNLSQWLSRDADRPGTSHDFGKDIIPAMLAAGERLYAYNYLDNEIPGQSEHYWRDVGTIGALHAANMDLVQKRPDFNIYNIEGWPIRTEQRNLPPAKFNEINGRSCTISNALTSGGCIVEASTIRNSVLGCDVRVYESSIEDSVLFSRVRVRHGCQLRRVMVDRGVEIPPGTSIGIDHNADRARGLTVDEESGIVVVSRGAQF